MTDLDAIADALRDVSAPDLGGNVIDAGLVTDANIRAGTVTLDVELAGLGPDKSEGIVEEMRAAVLALSGVERVRVEDGSTPDSSAASVNLAADRVIAVASAKGGVGKSTVAAALARGLSERGTDIGLFDADIHGPNVPDLVGAEGPVTTTAKGQAAPVKAAGLDVMSIGLLENDAPIAWRGAMAHEALLDLLGDTAWGDLDTLVVDLPPGTGDIVLTTLQDVPVDGVVLVTTPYPTAIEDSGRSAQLFEENGIPILGTAINMAGFTCPTCGDDHNLFGDEALTSLDVPVLAEIPFDATVQVPEPPFPDAIAALVEEVRDRIDDVGFEVPDTALDVSGVPAGIRIELVTEEFAALSPGEELYVLTDQEPDSLLAAIGSRGQECACGHDDHGGQAFGPDGTGVEKEVGLTVETEVQQVSVGEWAVRVAKPAEKSVVE